MDISSQSEPGIKIGTLMVLKPSYRSGCDGALGQGIPYMLFKERSFALERVTEIVVVTYKEVS